MPSMPLVDRLNKSARVIKLASLLLIVVATIAATVVFGILGLLNALSGLFKGGRTPEAKRKNVRVINRD